jgi:hypothetical protein
MRLDRYAAGVSIAVLAAVGGAASHAEAACSRGRLELIGSVPDIFFQHGVPASRIVNYRWKSIDTNLSECGVYARSIAEGVSVVASYGNPGTVHPPFSWAWVGGASAPGGVKTGSFEVRYDGTSVPHQSYIDLAQNGGGDVGFDPRSMSTLNVYIDSSFSPTWFTVKAVTSNISGHRLVVSHPRLNGKAHARIFVTSAWNPGGTPSGVYDNHPVSVRYDAALARWTIQHDNLAPMALGTAYHVRVDPSVRRVTAVAGGNIFFSMAFVRDITADGNPNALLMVTPVDEGVKNPHPIAARYVAPYWAIWNTDGAPMPAGAAWNVKVIGFAHYVSQASGNSGSPLSVSAGVDIDGAARTFHNWRTFDWPWLNGLPSTQLVVTANWNPLDRNPGVTNARYTGVWYTAGRWAVFNQDWWTPMAHNASYNVWAAPPPTPPVVHR